MSQIIERLADVAGDYRAAFVDLWGCVHDGVRAYPEAVAALTAYREGGGIVVLVTNSPRPRVGVMEQIEALGVPGDAWDAIATSGDSARAAMFRGMVGGKVWVMGTSGFGTDFFAPMDVIDDPVAVRTVPLDEAEGVVCLGPEDPLADPQSWRADLLMAKARGLPLLCANPDIVVDRGEVREWCAGAVARMYTEMGGTSLYFGKPHPPIYDLARRRLAKIADVADDRILCIGDGLGTDIQGAQGEALDALFLSGGLMAEETRTAADGGPDPDALAAVLADAQVSPRYTMGRLR